MNKIKKKGFTLIELIAVLVIMAIIALIVTPLVMNIIRKARVSADKRSIDAYGRSIELAIAGYLMDTGSFPTSIDQLTIEYSGDGVECSTTQINTDSSVYLAGCTVDGRSVNGYTYGKEEVITYDAYSVGDEVTYNGVDYYVIKDSDITEESVTLLKAEPLTVAEVNKYGAGHINRYTYDSVGTAYNQNGYGGMAYYTSETCGYVNNNWINDECTTDYAASDVKYVVDGWKIDQSPLATQARLMTKEEIDDNFEFEEYDCCGGCGQCKGSRLKDTWIYNSKYSYWTMSSDNFSYVWYVFSSGTLNTSSVNNFGGQIFGVPDKVVRPVIVLPKSAL